MNANDYRNPDECYPTALYINGNAALDAVASAGNGTVSNPYIIENISFGTSYCLPWIIPTCIHSGMLMIANTTAYLVVRNCSFQLYACYWQVPSLIGIMLSNVSHYTLINNTMTFTPPSNAPSQGIVLDNASHGLIANNSIDGVTGSGIFSSNSSWNNISQNHIVNNMFGITLRGSSSNRLYNNTVNKNWAGITLYYNSDLNLIYNNTLLENYDGISIGPTCSGNLLLTNEVHNRNDSSFAGWLIPTCTALVLLITIFILKRRMKKKANLKLLCSEM